MNFVKMQGNGNDFIVIDDRENKFNHREKSLAIKLCDRNFGIGGDGILIIRESNSSDIQMLIYNADGSYASMCGNGIRCFAKYVYDYGIVKKEVINIQTGDGEKKAYINLEKGAAKTISINMGTPSFNPQDFAGDFKENVLNKEILIGDNKYLISSMFMGVPHTVVFGKLDEFDIKEGKYIEKYEKFKEGTNVNFTEVVSKNHIKVKTWERGAGPTLACGTGSCAAVIAAMNLGYTGSLVKVEVPGGEMIIEVKDEGIMMTGPAEISFKGEIIV